MKREISQKYSIRFVTLPKFSILGSNREISPCRGKQCSFFHDDSLRVILGFEPTVIYDEYNLSDKPVDI